MGFFTNDNEVIRKRLRQNVQRSLSRPRLDATEDSQTHATHWWLQAGLWDLTPLGIGSSLGVALILWLLFGRYWLLVWLLAPLAFMGLPLSGMGNRWYRQEVADRRKASQEERARRKTEQTESIR